MLKYLSRSFPMSFIFLLLPTTSALGDIGKADPLNQGTNLLVLQIAIIVAAAWAGGTLFKKFHMPRVLGEVASGVIVGPYLLGSIPSPFFSGGVFPSGIDFPISPELYGIAAIASIILLFMIGLETDVKMLFKFSVAGAVTGISGVIISFLAGMFGGALFMKYFYGLPFSPGHPVTLFLGVISTATSVGITARILSQRKKIDSPEGMTTLSAAVVDDILGIIALAIVMGVARRGVVIWKEVYTVSLRALGIWFFFTAAGLIFSKNIASFLKKFNDRPTMSVMGLSLALLLAGIFERSGLAMIIGAYVTGISIAKTDISFTIRDDLAILEKFFVPVFFCVMGMLVDLRSLSNPAILLFALFYTLLAVLGKLCGCGLPPLLMNFNLRGASRIAVGMVPRGEVALIMSGVGLASGFIDQNVFNIAIIMTFITTLATPPVLDRMLKDTGPSVKKDPPQDKTVKTIKYDLPNPETTDLLLGKILTSFDEEGFFSHSVKIPEILYHFRKEDVSITLKKYERSLVFECSEDDMSFVNTVFYEVTAELDDLMKRLKTFSNREQVARDIFTLSSTNGKKRVRVSDALTPGTIKLGITGKDKNAVIGELVDLLISAGKLEIDKREPVLSELFAREKMMSTGMQDGVALPHARTESVEHLVSAVGIRKEGVDFESLDMKPSQIVVLTLAPKNHREPYLQFVGEITKTLIDPDMRKKLLDCKDHIEVYELLARE